MLKRRLCEATFTWQLRCPGPLLIADGRYDKDHITTDAERAKNYPDKIFINRAPLDTMRSTARSARAAEELTLPFYVPATSLRGPFRAQAERIVRSLLPEEAVAPQTACDPFAMEEHGPLSCSKRFDLTTPSVPYAAACPACKLFGCTGTASRIQFSDAEITGMTPKSRFRSVYRDMIGIDRFTGGVSQGANMKFHALEQTALTTTVTLINFELWQLGLLAYVFRDFQMGLIPIGSGKTKGFGLVYGEVTGITLTYVAGKANAAVQHLGTLASTQEHAHYGLHRAAAPAYALAPTASSGFGLYEAFTVPDRETFWAVTAPAFNDFIIQRSAGE